MTNCLLIMGMHRTGTSAMAGAVRLLGAELGSNLMPARDGDNEKGFFEDLEIFDIHNHVFDQLGYTWDDPRALPASLSTREDLLPYRDRLAQLLGERFLNQPLWAVKDPRISLLVPFWLEILEAVGVAPRFVILQRHPGEVAASLALRNGFSPEKSASLWLNYNLSAELATRGYPRVFASYEDLLEKPVEALEAMAGRLRLEWPREPAAAAAEIHDFLSRELRHHVIESTEVDFGRFGEWVSPLHDILRGANVISGEELQRRADAIGEEVRAMKSSIDALSIEHTAQAVISLQGQIRLLERHIAELSESLEERFVDSRRWMKSQDEEFTVQRQSLTALANQLDERAQWLKLQEEERSRQKQAIRSIEEQLAERTEWLRIQSESIDSLQAQLDRIKSTLAGEDS